MAEARCPYRCSGVWPSSPEALGGHEAGLWHSRSLARCSWGSGAPRAGAWAGDADTATELWLVENVAVPGQCEYGTPAVLL